VPKSSAQTQILARCCRRRIPMTGITAHIKERRSMKAANCLRALVLLVTLSCVPAACFAQAWSVGLAVWRSASLRRRCPCMSNLRYPVQVTCGCPGTGRTASPCRPNTFQLKSDCAISAAGRDTVFGQRRTAARSTCAPASGRGIAPRSFRRSGCSDSSAAI
jgi:hypothetical protein